MEALRSVLERAEAKGVAVGHFNISDLVALKALVTAAKELKVPLIVGVSESEREFMGLRQVVALMRSLRDESDFPIFLNADHTHSIEKAIETARAGFDLIVFDASALPFEQNVAETRKAVQEIKAIDPAILVEGEVGDIGTGSRIHEDAPDIARGLTSPDEAKQFVAATGVDILSPAVGTMHGMLRSMVQGTTRKHLDIERIAQIKQATQVPLTLHGGSGTADQDFRKAITAGINIIHVNTELRVAWRRALDEALRKHPDEIVPYKILEFPLEAMKQIALSRMKLFNNL